MFIYLISSRYDTKRQLKKYYDLFKNYFTDSNYCMHYSIETEIRLWNYEKEWKTVCDFKNILDVYCKGEKKRSMTIYYYRRLK